MAVTTSGGGTASVFMHVLCMSSEPTACLSNFIFTSPCARRAVLAPTSTPKPHAIEVRSGQRQPASLALKGA